MIINKALADGELTFVLEGKLDTTTSPQLQDVLLPAFDEAGHIRLDFTKVAYVSSAGLRVLLMGQKTAKAKGASMTLSGISAEIMEIFEMTGFTGMLTIV